MAILSLILGGIIGFFGSLAASFFFWRLLRTGSAKLKIFGKLILNKAENDSKVRIAFLIYNSLFRRTMLTDLDLYAYLVANVNGDKWGYFGDGYKTLTIFPVRLNLNINKLAIVEYLKNEYKDNWLATTVAIELFDKKLWNTLNRILNHNNAEVAATLAKFKNVFGHGNEHHFNNINDRILLDAFIEVFSCYFDGVNFVIIGEDPFTGLRKFTKRTIKDSDTYDCRGRVNWGKLIREKS